VKHFANRDFWKRYYKLPQKAQVLADENFKLLKENPRHPSLHFKRIGNFWSARAGLDHRALAVHDEADFIWVWIGSHDAYQRMLKLSG